MVMEKGSKQATPYTQPSNHATYGYPVESLSKLLKEEKKGRKGGRKGGREEGRKGGKEEGREIQN